MKDRPRWVRLWIRAGVVILLALALLRLVSALRASASPVLRTVTVGQFPSLPVVDAPQGRLFVANTDDETESVLDTRDGRLLRTTPVGSQAGAHVWNVVADVPGGHVFVRTGDDVLTTLDATSGAVVRTLSLEPCSQGLAVDTRVAHVFVAECDDGTVQMIDARSGRIVATIHVGGQPREVAVDEQSGRVLVVGGEPGGGGRISLLDASSGRVLRTFALGADLCLCITTPLPGGPVFVDDDQKAQVYVLDATSARLLRTVKIGMDIYDHAIDPRTGQVFLVGAPAGTASGPAPYTGPGRLVVLDGHSGRVVRHRNLSAPPSSVAVDARGQRLLLGLVGRLDSITGQPAGVGSVEVLDAHSLRVLRAIPAGMVPWQIAVDPRTDHAFVVNANVVPIGNDLSTYLPTSVTLPEAWWQATMRRVKHLLPWLPLRAPPPPRQFVNGSVTVLDLARV